MWRKKRSDKRHSLPKHSTTVFSIYVFHSLHLKIAVSFSVFSRWILMQPLIIDANMLHNLIYQEIKVDQIKNGKQRPQSVLLSVCPHLFVLGVSARFQQVWLKTNLWVRWHLNTCKREIYPPPWKQGAGQEITDGLTSLEGGCRWSCRAPRWGFNRSAQEGGSQLVMTRKSVWEKAEA